VWQRQVRSAGRHDGDAPAANWRPPAWRRHGAWCATSGAADVQVRLRRAVLQPRRGENGDHFNPVLNPLFCSCFHGMVSCVFFLFTSHGLRRHEASATLQRVFIRTGPAYVCVSCSSPYLRPGGDADLWRRAVGCGVIDEAESIDAFKKLGVRKSAVREGENANGTVLGWCLPCYSAFRYSACRPLACKRLGTQFHSLLHSLVKTDAAASSVPGPACLPFLWVPEKTWGASTASSVWPRKGLPRMQDGGRVAQSYGAAPTNARVCLGGRGVGSTRGNGCHATGRPTWDCCCARRQQRGGTDARTPAPDPPRQDHYRFFQTDGPAHTWGFPPPLSRWWGRGTAGVAERWLRGQWHASPRRTPRRPLQRLPRSKARQNRAGAWLSRRGHLSLFESSCHLRYPTASAGWPGGGFAPSSQLVARVEPNCGRCVWRRLQPRARRTTRWQPVTKRLSCSVQGRQSKPGLTTWSPTEKFWSARFAIQTASMRTLAPPLTHPGAGTRLPLIPTTWRCRGSATFRLLAPGKAPPPFTRVATKTGILHLAARTPLTGLLWICWGALLCWAPRPRPVQRRLRPWHVRWPAMTRQRQINLRVVVVVGCLRTAAARLLARLGVAKEQMTMRRLLLPAQIPLSPPSNYALAWTRAAGQARWKPSSE